MKKLYLKILSALVITNIFSTQIFAGEFKTILEYPNISDAKFFPIISNYSHKLLFYTGKKDGEFINGYYRSSHFLGWRNNDFTPLDNYLTKNSKEILDVSAGPNSNMVVLSHVDENILISHSPNGKSWQTKLINDQNIAKLNYINTFNLNKIVAYSQTNANYIVSFDSENWQAMTLPNGCSEKPLYCTIENKFFGSNHNYFVLIQTTSLSGAQTNKLHYSTNLNDWYNKDLPFDKDFIQNIYQSGEMLAFSVIGETGHKLWTTQDLETWNTYDLPNAAKLADLKQINYHRIAMLLTYDTYSDFVFLNLDTKDINSLHKFPGKVNTMLYRDDKLYLVGNFINPNTGEQTLLAYSDVW